MALATPAATAFRYSHGDPSPVLRPDTAPQVPVNSPQHSALRRLPRIPEQADYAYVLNVDKISSLEMEIYRLSKGLRGLRRKPRDSDLTLNKSKSSRDTALRHPRQRASQAQAVNDSRQPTATSAHQTQLLSSRSRDVADITYTEQRAQNAASKRVDIRYRDVTSQTHGAGDSVPASARDSMLNVTRSTLPSLTGLSLTESDYCACGDAHGIALMAHNIDDKYRQAKYANGEFDDGYDMHGVPYDGATEDEFTVNISVEICEKCGKRRRLTSAYDHDDVFAAGRQKTFDSGRHSASKCQRSRSTSRANDVAASGSARSMRSGRFNSGQWSSNSLDNDGGGGGSRMGSSCAQRVRTTSSQIKKRQVRVAASKTRHATNGNEMRGGVFEDGDKTAYMLALNAARMRRYEYNMQAAFANQTTRSYTFSYFEHLPTTQLCPDCGEVHRRNPARRSKRAKRTAPMKQVFGDVKKDDYFPGQIRNPFPKIATAVH